MKKETNNNATIAGVGAGVLVTLAAAYFLYGSKDAPKNRKVIKGWMLKAKGEVLEKFENLKEVNEDRYYAVVDTVMNKYKMLKSLDPNEVMSLASDLKRHWKNIKADLTTTKAPKRVSKKSASTK